MPCMFCRSNSDLTSEHVFPAFIGGELEVPDGSCKQCNGEFGRCEAAIKESTLFLLNLLSIENRYGDVPVARVSLGIRGMQVEGLFGFRESGGTINLSDVVIESPTEDGKKRREGFFISKESAEKFIERARARGEQVKELEVPEEVVIDASYTLTLPFAFSLEARRVAGKIALVAIAHQYGLSYALSEQFDVLRQSLTRDDATNLLVRIFANKSFMAAHIRTPHQHSVMCYLSAGMRSGWALVTLFGGLSYVIKTTATYSERASRQFSLFCDAAAKTPLRPVVLEDEIALIGKVLSAETKFEDRDAVDAQWFPIIAEYCAERGIDIERITGSNAMPTGPSSP